MRGRRIEEEEKEVEMATAATAEGRSKSIAVWRVRTRQDTSQGTPSLPV